MRLWHKELLHVLPKQQLLGQWRECCCIARSLAILTTPNHILVNKICKFPLSHFYTFSRMVCEEMWSRGYSCDWTNFAKWVPGLSYSELTIDYDDLFEADSEDGSTWHNDRYFWQCYYNLEEKYDCGGISENEWEYICDECSYKL